MRSTAIGRGHFPTVGRRTRSSTRVRHQPFSLYREWHPFGDAIQWLDQPPLAPARRGTFAYRLGRLRFSAFDFDGNWLPAVTSNAWFFDNAPGAPGQVRAPNKYLRRKLVAFNLCQS
jgi:hypothetical protein